MIPQAIKNSKAQKYLKAALFIAFTFVVFINFFISNPAHTAPTKPVLPMQESSLQEKIEKYKKFKAKHEDKDFRLKASAVKRSEHGNRTSETYFFNIYNIIYGITEDNIREYNAYSKQIVRNPILPEATPSQVCQSGLYVEEYNESGRLPEVTCSEETEHAYPISLILKSLSKQELENVVIIYEFEDGDVDIRFSFEKGRDKKFVEDLYLKLKDADEQNDAQKPEAEMQPIIPTDNQRVTSVFLEEDENGEPEFAFLPYCIDGSFFDRDPHNDAIQVGLKYKLVTSKDLVDKPEDERIILEKRLGLWMWDKPSEILTSFTENPGPDIVFYDIGKVVDSIVIDTRPDGKFDTYKFLY